MTNIQGQNWSQKKIKNLECNTTCTDGCILVVKAPEWPKGYIPTFHRNRVSFEKKEGEKYE